MAKRRLNCPFCGKRVFVANPEGASVRCMHCGRSFTVDEPVGGGHASYPVLGGRPFHTVEKPPLPRGELRPLPPRPQPRKECKDSPKARPAKTRGKPPVAPVDAGPAPAPTPRRRPPASPHKKAQSAPPLAPAAAPPPVADATPPPPPRAQAAVVRRFHFPTVEAMVQFLDICLGGSLVKPEQKRDIRVHLPADASQGVWVDVPLTEDAIAAGLLETAKLLKACDAVLAGPAEKVGLNEFLERVRLRGRPALPEAADCLFVHKTGGTLREMADLYESFPRGQYVDCRFFFGHGEADGSPHALLLFERLRSVARVAQWAKQLPPGVTAFCPVDGTAHSVFFSPWQQVHPVAALPRLYDAGDSRYVLMTPSAGGGHPWLKISRAEAEDALACTHQVFRVVVPDVNEPWAPARDLTADPPKGKLDVPIRAVRPRESGLAVVGPLVRRVEALRQRLTDLESRYEAAQQAGPGQCRVALTFYQNHDSDSLPPRLHRFLQRPYQTLEGYTYGFLQSGKHRRHVLFSKAPVPLADALVACADELHVQDARWQGWNLNVFLRHGVDLLPRLDDPAMADQLKAFLDTKDGRPAFECCLMDAEPSPDGRKGCRISLVSFAKTRPLPEMIRFLNETDGHQVRRVGEKLPETLRGSIEARGLEVADELKELQRTLAAELEQSVQKTLKQWLEVRKRADQVFGAVLTSKEDVELVEALLDKMGRTWEGFVWRVLGLHLHLSERKRGAFAALDSVTDEFAQAADRAVVANKAAQDKITEADARIQLETRRLNEAETRTQAGFTAIQNSHAAFTRALAAAKAKVKGLDETLQKELDQANVERAAVADETVQLGKRLAEIRKVQAQLRAQRAAALKLLEEIRIIREENGRNEAFVVAKMPEAKKKKAECERLRQALRLKCREINDTIASFDGRCRQYAKGMASAQAFGLLWKHILEVFLTRPGLIGRGRAMLLFGRLLKEAPFGFYEDERDHDQDGSPHQPERPGDDRSISATDG